MFVDFNILNQLGSPSINSNTFANRPAAGQTGRLFVSTDTFEIYRDNGTTWDLIGGPGSSTITGTGTATQVAYFTSSQAIGSSSNLFWDNTNTRLGVGTASPGYTIEANGAVKADRIYLTGATAANGALYWTSDRVTVANYNVGGIVLIETNGGPTAATFGADYTATFVSGIGTRGYTGSTSYGALFNGSVGINTATPGAELDVHGTGVIAQLNSTSATANSLLAFQRSGSGLWRIGDTYNGGNNYFELHNTVLTNNAIEVLAASNEATFVSSKTYSSGNAIGVAVQHNLTIPNGVNVGLAAIGGVNSNLNLSLGGNTTVAATGRQGLEGSTSISFTGAGTLTMTQGSTVRAFSALGSVYAFNGSAVGTITHLAGLRICFPDNVGSAVNVTNNYALLINNQTAGTGTVTYTNRWGIYQEGASDLNYLAANLLIGSTTNSGEALQVTGTAKVTSTLTANSLVKSGGTASQILAADGSVITAGTNITIAAGQISSTGGGITGSGAAGQVTYWSSASAVTGNNNLFWDNTNARLGINTSSPQATLDVRISSYTPTGQAASLLVEENTTWTQGIAISAYQAGTQFSSYPSGFIGVANNNNAFYLSGGARIVNNPASSNWARTTSATSASFLQAGGGTINFYTNSGLSVNTVYTPTERMRFTSSGQLALGTTTPGSILQVNGNAAIGYSASTAAPTNGLAVAGNIALNSTISAWTSLFNVIEGTTYSGYLGFQTNAADMKIGINHFYDGIGPTGYKYKTTNAATQLNISASNGFQVNTAPSGTAGTNIAAFTTIFSVSIGGQVTIATGSNVSAISQTGYSLTGANAQSLLDLAGTWNTTGNPTAIKLNITNTASGATAYLMDLQVGAATQFRVTKAGAIRTAAPTTGTANDWKLGTRVAAAVVLDTTQYIELEVGGTLYKLAIVT